jgi:signal transduction histidine kinase
MISLDMLILFFIAVLNVFLALVVFRNNKNRLVNRVFAIFLFFIVIWIITVLASNIVKNYNVALFINRLVFAIDCLMVFSLYSFSLVFPFNEKIKSKKIYLLILGITLVVSFFSLFSNFIIHDIEILEWGSNPVGGSAYVFFMAFLVIMLILSVFHFFKNYKRSDGVGRLQFKYLLFGLLATIIIVLITGVIIPITVGTSKFATIGLGSIVFFNAMTTYAIVKHRLLDIRLVILRTITYSLVVLLISATVVILTLFLPEALAINTTIKAIIAVIASIFIVLILDPLKKTIGKATDALFFKARIDYQKLLTEIGEVINREIDLDVLLYSMSRKLEKELKIKNVSIYLAGTAGGAFFKRKGRVDKEGKKVSEEELEKMEKGTRDLGHRIAHDSPLVKYMWKEREIIVLEGLERKVEDMQDEKERQKLEASKAALDKLDSAVVAPIIVGNSLNAVMVLGPKLSGDPFGSEDLNLLHLIGPQLASALEKSRLYDEAKQFTERLKKEVAVATEHLQNTNIQLQERNKFLAALQKVTTLITQTLDFKKVTQAIADSITTELGYLGGIVLFLGKDRHKLFPDAITQAPITKKILKLLPKPFTEYYGNFDKDKSRSITAIKEDKVQIGGDLSDFISPAVPSTICKGIQKVIGAKTMVAVPISTKGINVGAIVYLIKKAPDELKDTDLSIMKALASQTGIVYQNIQLYRQIQESNKELEEANKHLHRLDQAKSEFVSITSHQLRTPMTGIMGYLSMILQGDFGKVPKEQNKILHGLLDESQRMIRLINLFLNVSKIESGKLELNLQPTRIGEVVEKVINMAKKAAEDKKLKLVYNKPKKLLPLITADHDKLGDVVQNLVDNAIKYTDKGSVTVDTKVDGNYVRFSVIDTGRGIPSGEAKRLFTKFVRGYGIAQVNPDGSGLGLYVARRLTEAHRGKIWVDSGGLGKGSTFHVRIPIAKEKNK